MHGMFGWSGKSSRVYDGSSTMSDHKLSELRAFCANTDVFMIDEVCAMSAAMLTRCIR